MSQTPSAFAALATSPSATKTMVANFPPIPNASVFDVDARLGDLLQHTVVVADFVRVLYPERGLGLGRLAQLVERLLRAVEVGGEEMGLRFPGAHLVRPTRGDVDLRFAECTQDLRERSGL